MPASDQSLAGEVGLPKLAWTHQDSYTDILSTSVRDNNDSWRRRPQHRLWPAGSRGTGHTPQLVAAPKNPVSGNHFDVSHQKRS